MANMIPISTVTVGSGGVASIAFNNIPQTYTDLFLVLSTRKSGSGDADNMLITFNGSSSNFSGRYLFTNVSATTASGTDTTPAGAATGAAFTANTFSNVSIYIPNYSSSSNKSFSVDSTAENNGTTANLYFDAKLWSNTSPISSIGFTNSDSTNFVQYSSATLYGIRKY